MQKKAICYFLRVLALLYATVIFAVDILIDFTMSALLMLLGVMGMIIN